MVLPPFFVFSVALSSRHRFCCCRRSIHRSIDRSIVNRYSIDRLIDDQFLLLGDVVNGLFLKSVPHKECTKKLCWPVSSVAPLSLAAPVSSAALKKKHLIGAAPFGRLDQMLRTTVQGVTHPTMTLGPPPLPDQRGDVPPTTKNCHELN